MSLYMKRGPLPDDDIQVIKKLKSQDAIVLYEFFSNLLYVISDIYNTCKQSELLNMLSKNNKGNEIADNVLQILSLMTQRETLSEVMAQDDLALRVALRAAQCGYAQILRKIFTLFTLDELELMIKKPLVEFMANYVTVGHEEKLLTMVFEAYPDQHARLLSKVALKVKYDLLMIEQYEMNQLQWRKILSSDDNFIQELKKQMTLPQDDGGYLAGGEEMTASVHFSIWGNFTLLEAYFESNENIARFKNGLICKSEMGFEGKLWLAFNRIRDPGNAQLAIKIIKECHLLKNPRQLFGWILIINKSQFKNLK